MCGLTIMTPIRDYIKTVISSNLRVVDIRHNFKDISTVDLISE